MQKMNNSQMNNKVPTEGTVILESLVALSKSGGLHDLCVPLGFTVYTMETVGLYEEANELGPRL